MYAIKGDLVWSEKIGQANYVEDGYLIIKDGKIVRVAEERPDVEIKDYTGHLVIPGLVDLHLHASQYPFCGLWMDEELLTWLDRHAFPMEAKFSDLSFAKSAYKAFVDEMKRGGTTRFACFATIHKDATFLLMQMLEESGLSGYVGKVNMDSNSPPYLTEDTEESIKDTLSLIERCEFENIKAIITPRFVPSCSAKLLSELGRISEERGLPVQSHLSENTGEVSLVSSLYPEDSSYASVYDKFSLLNEKTIMAHGVLLKDEEIELIRERGSFIAHAPSSNTNLSSGIAPIRRLIKNGINVGLSTDVAAGSSASVFRAITDAVQVSKLRWRLISQEEEPLKFAEAFFLATKGGGKFFGRTGSFEEGYDADVLVLDDKPISSSIISSLSPLERLEYYTYRNEGKNIKLKLCKGRVI